MVLASGADMADHIATLVDRLIKTPLSVKHGVDTVLIIAPVTDPL
jgi:hypothetical protein